MSKNIPGRLLFSLTFCASLWCGCSHSVSTTINSGASSVVLPDSVNAWLNGQAPIIGFYAAVAKDSSYLDTILLPTWAATKAYNAIGRLWLTSGMPERDTVFDVYALRETGDNDFHSVIVCGDTPITYQSVLNKYQFARDTSVGIIVYRTPLLVNTIGVAIAINDSLGFPDPLNFGCAEPDGLFGGNMSVQATFEQNDVLLNYTLGWGDCPSGCIDSRTWSFKVPNSGFVQFTGVTGDAPPPS